MSVASLPSLAAVPLLPSLWWSLKASLGGVTDRTMCVRVPEECSWKQIICSPTCVNIEGVLSSTEINCSGKGSVVSFLKARNSSPALQSCSLATGAGPLTDHMLACLNLLHQPHRSVRRSSRKKREREKSIIKDFYLVTFLSFAFVVAALCDERENTSTS